VAPVVTTAGLVGRQTHRVEPALAQAEVAVATSVAVIMEEEEEEALMGQEPLQGQERGGQAMALAYCCL
jgi:hypothetical protein